MESIIKNNYFEYSQTEEYAREQDAFDTIAYHNGYERLVKDFDDEPFFVGAVAESEQFGFIQGFKYAMRLCKECNI